MLKLIKFSLLCVITVANSLAFAKQNHKIPGFVTHGINVYNNRAIVDYTTVIFQPFAIGLNRVPLITEVGFYQPGQADSGAITALTNGDSLLATSSVFSQAFRIDGFMDPALFNRPLDTIGSNFFGSRSSNDRKAPVPTNLAQPGDLYIAEGVIAGPTVAQWKQISGVMEVVCEDDGSGVVEVAVRDALPNQLYSLWDIGILRPQTGTERTYVSPLGGLPNVVVTDSKGCGYKKMKVPFCPTRSCDAGSDSCTAYVSLFYHWDDQIYGGEPALMGELLPVGVMAANQMLWPTSGDLLQEPATQFKGQHLRCNQGSKN